MATYIRLTDYKSSDEKERGFFDPKNRYEAKQKDFEKIPGSPIAYWVSDRVKEIFEKSEKLGEIAEPKGGMSTSDNERFLRYWNEVNYANIAFHFENLIEAKKSNLKWFPYNKGGEFRKWYGNMDYLVNYLNDGLEVKMWVVSNPKDPKTTHWSRRLFNTEYYLKSSISWTLISSSNFGARYFPTGFIFDSNGLSVFIKDSQKKYLLSLLSSKISKYFLKIISSTIAFLSGDIKKIPIFFPKSEATKQQIDQLTQQNIDISKEEWDSRETSWDFKASPLLIENGELRIENGELKIENGKIEDAYERYCEYWREKFNTLHKNEEELNRLFIDIYELQDELTPDVALKDITILKNEAKIVDGKLKFKADEIMKQFISYAVGVMLGRYSLDHEGLHIANMGESIEEVNAKFNIQNPTFEADDDNVIPVLEDDYFKDDIASRFIQFVKVTFGEENLSQNLRFIEDALKTTIRKYFLKGFYEDHIKRYKKRPIYWMVSSPKKGFMSLIYMHRYKPDTFARVRNSYLTEYIAKLEAHKETLALTTSSDTASNADKKSANKQMKNINTKLKEIIEFDRDKMMHFAQNQIEIDLDDGVKVNYCKFKDILYSITGLCK